MKKKVAIPKTAKAHACAECGEGLQRHELLEAPCPYCGKQFCDACYAQHHFTCLDNHPTGGHIESEEWGYECTYGADRTGIFSSEQGAIDDAKDKGIYQKVKIGRAHF